MKRFTRALARASALACVAAAALVACGGSDDKYPTLTGDKPLVIGAGALVGMGAVVTRDVAPGAVVVGNPARVMAPKN